VLLYIQRWLTAPTQLADGSLVERTAGTPQGGVVSPLLANLYLHYGFDLWMVREFPDIPFERYADDVICHCSSEAQATHLKDAIEQRFAACSLTLHPQKTKIAYCKDDRRRGTHPIIQFDFLGYSFQPRAARADGGELFVGFNPAISTKSATSIRQRIRGWRVHLRSDLDLGDIAKLANPALRGWINYYGLYNRLALQRVLHHFDSVLERWAMRKYKHLQRRPWNARRWVSGLMEGQADLFAHWQPLGRTAG
jgi:group II intron reverse transcriptase/maturase